MEQTDLFEVTCPYGRFFGSYDCGDGCRMDLYEEITKERFEHWIGKLTAGEDAELYARWELGSNCYVTFRTSGNRMLHLSYSACDATVRVLKDPMEGRVFPPVGTEDQKEVQKPYYAVMSLDYSHRDVTDGNGMSYVFGLSDGSFLIYDGGYSQDTDSLYRFLKDRRPDRTGKIRIAAWVFTHSHVDHYGNFRQFAEKYADKVEVEYFISNHPCGDYFNNPNQYDNYLGSEWKQTLSDKFPDAKLIKLHSGQKLCLHGAELQALFSIEDVYPHRLNYLNEASLVTQVTLKGQKFLFLADAEIIADRLMPPLLGTALKSDFVQVAHHGYSGGSEELYRLIDPTYATWTTSQIAFEIRIKDSWPRGKNRLIAETVGKDHCFVADGPCKIFSLPCLDGRCELWQYSQITEA